MPRVEVKVVEALAVMANYNPFFEKAGMMKVEYCKDETLLERKTRYFLTRHSFEFNFLRSGNYCREFFNRLNEENKKELLNHLAEFADEPFIKRGLITAELLSRILPAETSYYYWINSSKIVK